MDMMLLYGNVAIYIIIIIEFQNQSSEFCVFPAALDFGIVANLYIHSFFLYIQCFYNYASTCLDK